MTPRSGVILAIVGVVAILVVAAAGFAARVSWPLVIFLEFGTTLVGVTLVFALVFRCRRAVIAAAIPLVVGFVWTLGIGGALELDAATVGRFRPWSAVVIAAAMSGLIVAAARVRDRDGRDLVAPVTVGVALVAIAIGLANLLDLVVFGAAVVVLAPVTVRMAGPRPNPA